MLQFGLREDLDRFLRDAKISPRVALSYLPLQGDRAKLTVGWGAYYQPVRLSLLGQTLDQERVDIFYDSTGSSHVSGPVASRFALPSRGLRSPHFHTTSVEWTQTIRRNTFAGIDLIHRNQRLGLAYENPQPGLFLLQNNRRDLYRAVHLSLRHSFGEKAEISADYTRSSARSNEVLDYSLRTLVFSPQGPGPLSWDAPDRFVSSGWAPAPLWQLFVSYFLEYRTGFPFSVVNEQQQLVGAPNRLRFPNYLSLNIGLEKRFRLFSREWATRLAVINAVSRSNPNAVINNVDAPSFLKFTGGQRRAFTIRLRLVR